MTYKLAPGQPSTVTIGDPYGRADAERVILAAMQDYQTEYGGLA
jgi:hypothetical protein